ncbi:hypothetical protein [uncultured Muribaculum sp.]|uniref:hypothetical protein n=1 Tax=uncultured Muribaculum sp. TaxID=1918613 RepID=UPI0025EFACDF|nr:hypothetical protein [uncultured Muribaculum sp.]
MKTKLIWCIFIVIIILICLLEACGKPSDKKADYRDYPLVQYMREYGWMGLGDSTTNYPQDSILYNGLKIDGKSLSEVESVYWHPDYIIYDTIRYGISQRRPYPSPLFPLVYRQAEVPVIFALWDIAPKVRLGIYFENYDNQTKAIYGMQFRYEYTYE